MSIASALVKLATWNLLAPQYARIEKYPWCDSHFLDWGHRQSLIIPQLLAMDADIICLQEVQLDVWPDLLSQLECVYDGVIQNMTDGHNVANAVLLRKNSPLKIERVESRSRVLLTVLRQENSHRRQVYLATLHLEAGTNDDNDMQRYHQLKSLFKRLTHHCEMDGLLLQNATIILAGDFNMLRSNLMHQCLSDGELVHPDEMNNKPPIKIARLHDTFLMGERRSVQMTFAKGYVLDYIWASADIRVGKTLPISLHATKAIPQQWPSRDQPSDHLPIGVELVW